MSEPIKLYGAGILTLPIGFHAAKSREDQMDALWEIADDPKTSRADAERYLRVISKLRTESPAQRAQP